MVYFFLLVLLIFPYCASAVKQDGNSESLQSEQHTKLPRRQTTQVSLEGAFILRKPQQATRHSTFESLVVGIGAGTLEAALNHPLWVWKTRKQYGDPFTLTPKVIYKGVGVSVSFMAAIIGTRVVIRDRVTRYMPEGKTSEFARSSVSAFSGGAGSALITSPLELFLTQQQARSKKNKASFPQVWRDLINTTGSRVILRGFPCVAMRDGLATTGFLCFVPYFRAAMEDIYGGENSALSIGSGLFSGVLAAFLSHAFDTVKTIQHARALDKEGQQSAIKVTFNLWGKEGLKGFYKGFFWRGLRMTTGTPILFYSTEFFTKLYPSLNSQERY